MSQVRVPLPPQSIGWVAGIDIQVDASAPLGIAGTLWFCWLLVADRYPQSSRCNRFALTLIWSLLLFTAYLVHAAGHAVSARKAGVPVDVLLINAIHWVTLYRDNMVSPGQHIGRACGGPLANLLLYRIGRLLRLAAPPGPYRRDLVDAFALFNAGACAASLLPAGSFDGGTMLRWASYARTGDTQQAAEVVRRASLATSGLLGLAAAGYLLLRRTFWGVVLAAFSLVMALESMRRS